MGGEMTALLIFGSTFVLVFFKTVPQAGVLEIGAYLLAGPFAIVASMVVHKKWMRKWENKAKENPAQRITQCWLLTMCAVKS